MQKIKPRIIIVGDYNREDAMILPKLLHSEIQFFYIEYLNKKAIQNEECLKYGEVLFWKDFTDAYSLLEIVKPTKVIFYLIESYNQVALNVASKVMGIPTYHLEHGVRFPLSCNKVIKENYTLYPSKSFYKSIARFSDFFDKFRNRLFFERTKIKSPIYEKKFLSNYFKVRSHNSISETFQKLRSNLRLPDHYISFSPLVFNYHKELEGLPDNYSVRFIGIPQFDFFSKWKNIVSKGENILFIDQPLHEQHLYGWSLKNKELFLKELAVSVLLLGKKLFVKPHPLNHLNAYSIIMSLPNVEIMKSEWDKVVPEVSIVLGFYSTLLLPFIAMEHVSCFTMEMHPKKTGVPYSQFLLASGACHAVMDFEDLMKKLAEWENWNIKQREFKEAFIGDYMYKFDGKSFSQLRNILLEEIDQ